MVLHEEECVSQSVDCVQGGKVSCPQDCLVKKKLKYKVDINDANGKFEMEQER